MRKDKILICGANSFVGKGLAQTLISEGYLVDQFSRGKISTGIGNNIKGSYLEIDKNEHLNDTYSTVINFALLKDSSLNDNIKYIEALIKLCKAKHVKKLIHFSSIMVYNYALKDVNENTEIESLKNTIKSGYGEIKIGVDQYLIQQKENLPFELVLVRPGYVLADNRPCPFIKKLPFGFSIIKGNKKSKQPIVRREDIHTALLKIIETENNLPVYHLFPNNDMTKYRYAKQTTNNIILTMPKCIFKYIPLFFTKMGIIPKSLYSRFEGMYIESHFSSQLTEYKLNIQFK